jgi:peptidoglycan/xylan/chitin deacetylase (PgdA/CDA1 family)
MSNATPINRSLRWKRRLGVLWPAASGSREQILIYHSVAGGPLSTLRERFESQMGWLAEHTEVVPLDALLTPAGRQHGKPRVALTFDDGYRTLHDTAMPILQRYGFTATVYLNSGHIGEFAHEPSDAAAGHYPEEQFMTWSEVAALRDAGWTIGSHGVEHLDLTLQTPAVIEAELTASKQAIAERTGKPCEHFSYTWGHWNAGVCEAVEQAGYRTAVAGVHAPVTTHADPLALPRLDIRREYELADFTAVVRGKWDCLGLYQRMRRLLG